MKKHEVRQLSKREQNQILNLNENNNPTAVLSQEEIDRRIEERANKIIEKQAKEEKSNKKLVLAAKLILKIVVGTLATGTVGSVVSNLISYCGAINNSVNTEVLDKTILGVPYRMAVPLTNPKDTIKLCIDTHFSDETKQKFVDGIQLQDKIDEKFEYEYTMADHYNPLNTIGIKLRTENENHSENGQTVAYTQMIHNQFTATINYPITIWINPEFANAEFIKTVLLHEFGHWRMGAKDIYDYRQAGKTIMMGEVRQMAPEPTQFDIDNLNNGIIK